MLFSTVSTVISSYFEAMIYVTPAIFSLATILFLLFSLQICRDHTEKQIRIAIIVQFLVIGLLWTALGAFASPVFDQMFEGLRMPLPRPLSASIIRGMLAFVAYGAPMALFSVLYFKNRKNVGAQASQQMLSSVATEFSLLAFSITLTVIGGNEAAILDILNAATIPTLQIILVYMIIRRQYLSKYFRMKADASEAGENKTELHSIIDLIPSSEAIHPDKELSQKDMERYFDQKQPYTDPEFKLTDLADAMKMNRTEMSNFINKTYGMNFKRYVNRRRLSEYQRLMSLPSNELKNPQKILAAAGFSDQRHYNRVLQMESRMRDGDRIDDDVNGETGRSAIPDTVADTIPDTVADTIPRRNPKNFKE